MKQEEPPIGFSFALARDAAAMEAFMRLSQAEQGKILRQAESVRTKDEAQALVDTLQRRE